tara:strand:- start:6457 stop:7518 length:1062 start_codon:yes stop_codon:yes gene_type:complete
VETLNEKQTILSISEVKNNFYQCSFSSVIQTIDLQLPQENDLGKLQQLIQLKAKAQFELNLREEAMETLSLGKNLFHLKENADTWYALGSLDYFKGQFNDALKAFEKMLTYDLTPEKSFLALLSIANVHYSKQNWDQALAYAEELSQFKDGVPIEYQMSLELLNANILTGMNSSLKLGQEKYENVFTKASNQGWTFFALRSLYYLSKSYVKAQEVDQAKGMLKVLDMNLKALDWRFLSSLVNHEFEAIEFKATQSVQLDRGCGSVVIGNANPYEVSLKRWPQLFKLVELLFDKKDFVSKNKIASHLWPDQKYLPKTHDPRIYDLIARLKKKLEVSTDVSLLILAGNGGYKLSV